MTMHATRDGEKITVHGNTGVDVSVVKSQLAWVKITEDYRHLEWFHSQLGELIAAAKAEFTPAAE